jgi:hypothetical protein
MEGGGGLLDQMIDGMCNLQGEARTLLELLVNGISPSARGTICANLEDYTMTAVNWKGWCILSTSTTPSCIKWNWRGSEPLASLLSPRPLCLLPARPSLPSLSSLAQQSGNEALDAPNF